jgi:MoaA/NifB/PqqE/SkfB family radical SAM enzyme
MANIFCRYLSNGYRLVLNGSALTYKPCCWYTTEINVDDPNFERKKDRISKITDWVPECGCRSLEQSGVNGNLPPRSRSFVVIPDESTPDNIPVWVELSIDTTCNAACLSCGDHHSTTWRKQNIKFNIKNKDDLPDLLDPLELLEQIKVKFPLDNINAVNFLGGEPFQSPVTYEFLKYVKNLKGLQNLLVTISTNGSIQPDSKLVDLLSECKDVRYLFSLDGVGEQFEYIRYPLNWKKINDTVKFINATPGNKLLTVLSTVNPLNIFYYDQLEAWAKSAELDVNFSNIVPNRCTGTLDLALTPMELRKELTKKYGPDHKISKMISNLNYNYNYSSMIEYLDLWDNNRKTDWRKLFPEIVKYFN